MSLPLDPVSQSPVFHQREPAAPPATDPRAIAEQVVNGNSMPAGYDTDKTPRGGEQVFIDSVKLARLNEALDQDGITPDQAAAITEEVIRLDPDALSTWLSPPTIQANRDSGALDQQGEKNVSIGLAATYENNPDLRDEFHAALDKIYMPGALGGTGASADSIDQMLGIYSNAAFHPDQRALREGYAQHLLDTYVVGKDSGPESFHAAGIATSLITVDNASPQTVMNVLNKYSSTQISDILVQAQVSVETGTIPADRDVVSNILTAAGDIGDSRYSGFPYPAGQTQDQVLGFADKLIGAVGEMGVNAKDDPAIIQATGELFLAYAADKPAQTVDPSGPFFPGQQPTTRPAEPGLLTRYTSAVPGQVADTSNLATLISQGVFDPAAGDIKIGDRSLPDAINSAINTRLNQYLVAADAAPDGSDAQRRAIENFGQITAGVTGGIAKALSIYSDDIRASEESREKFADLVGAIGGDLLPHGGNTAATLLSELTNGVLGVLDGNPDRPDAALAAEIKDYYDAVIDNFATNIGQPDLRDAYRSARSDEVLDLQSKLNINLGGHEE
ncbi:hypothetical protein [Lysobacter sp. CA199]|uniref:hypothetical protein n=1 Tax=Lysobacter sp. CA199 TaxID=3455608 RepID=UPI003F8D05D5